MHRKRKALTVLLVFVLSVAAGAHPGGGLIAVDANTVIFPDPINNVVWRLEKGKEAHALMRGIHPHWVTRGLDSSLYVEGFGEIGGALFRVDLAGAKHTRIAEEKDLNAHVFAVGKSGELIFQKGVEIVARFPDGKVAPFRGSGKVAAGDPALQQVIAYAWAADETLYLSDAGNLRRVGKDGVIRFVAKVDGKLLEPRIWNSIDAPRIWSIAIDERKRIYTALPDTGEVVRIDPDGRQHVIDRYTGGWRVTGVAAFADNVFLLESSDRTNDGQRVRVIRSGANAELLGQAP